MEHFKIQLFSTSQFGGILDIGYTVEQSQIIFDLLDIFNAKFDRVQQKINSDYKHQNTKEFQRRLKNYVLKYKNIDPKVQQFSAKFKKLKEDEWFFLLPPIELNTKMQYELEKELNKLNGNPNIDDKEIAIFDCIMNNYELITFDLEKDRKIKIGENDRDKRVCRFCKEKQPNVEFRKEAHAISEALGNKKLILNEECDNCNKFFDENIERDFVYYHDFVRTIFGVKGKDNKLPTMKGKNFKFSKDKDSNNLSMLFNMEDDNGKNLPKNIILETGQKIKRQNIYKALCKFALSVLNTKYLIHFDDTIKWLKNEKKVIQLPKISVLNSYHFFTKIPNITLYLRNNNNKKIPYLIGEFKFTYYVYIFIIPFSNQDDNDFLSENEYQKFLNCFKHITVKSDKGQFQSVDFSQNLERELNFNIYFKQNIN